MKFLLSALCLLFTFSSFGQVNRNYHTVKKYTRKDGTNVQSYKRTNPNYTNRDNYTTRPNVNPHTGTRGYIAPDNNQDNSWISRLGTEGNLGYVKPYSYDYTNDGGLTGEQIRREIEFSLQENNNYGYGLGRYDIVATYRKNRLEKERKQLEKEKRINELKNKPLNLFTPNDWFFYHEHKEQFPSRESTYKIKNGIKTTWSPDGLISYEFVDNPDYGVGRTERAIRYHDKYDYETRLLLEQTLNSAGFEVGTVDGVFTNRTIEAIKDLQRALNISADGMFGEGTFRALKNY